ncbi:MAG: UbiX family flavin prenyltransferase [Armatimonadetes bacterium]|nr:UbiX family flavin prenyltransferase [Armatimonadota bacterium]
MPGTRRLVVAVTGASGALYAVRFLRQAAPHFDRIYVMLSDNAPAVFAAETGGTLTHPVQARDYLGGDAAWDNLTFLDTKDYFSPPASGSFLHDGMVVIPCSMGTLGRIAGGVSNDLTTRAADVCLKERRNLILVTRDTPLNLIHLRNMVTVTEAGAVVLPAVPAFYYQPKTVEDVVDTVVARVLQNLGVPQTLMPQWQAGEE